MPAAVGDVLGIQCVWLPSGFGGGVAVEPEPPTPPTLRGLPGAIPKPRKRPDVAEISGVGYVSVLGTGTLTGEACLAGELLTEPFGIGNLTRETWRILVGAIRTGAEAVIAGESSLSSLLFQMHRGAAIAVTEIFAGGEGAVFTDARAVPTADRRMVGLGRIRSGAAGVIRAQENDDDWIVAAGTIFARLLTRKRRRR